MQQSNSVEAVRDALQDLAISYYLPNLSQIQGHSAGGRSMFGDSHILISLSVIVSDFFGRHVLTPDQAEAQAAVSRRQAELFGDLLDEYLENSGGRIHDVLENHSFVTLHTTRALDLAAMTDMTEVSPTRSIYRRLIEDNREAPDSLWLLDYQAIETVIDARRADKANARRLVRSLTKVGVDARAKVLHQIGLAVSDNPKFDPASLVFNSLLLQRFKSPDSATLVKQAAELLVGRQGPGGTWQGGVISFGRMKVLFISSVELALSLCSLALMDLRHGDGQAATAVRPALDLAYRYVTSSYMYVTSPEQPEDNDRRLWLGWANDRSRSSDVIESWATALALLFLLRYEEVVREGRQRTVLSKYVDATLAGSGVNGQTWPDFDRFVRSRSRQLSNAASVVEQISDPTNDGNIRKGLLEEVLEPIIDNDFARPGSTRSLLLYGPPGSRKTSMMANVAKGLGWPLLVLSPPDFLIDGIERLEAQAREVFSDLQELRRVVVLFDECEEFFRRRMDGGRMESRTAGAFITTGMLPRLQALRSNRWSIFAIATNAELDELDPAVTRPGRLDIAQRVGLPAVDAQIQYLTEWHGGSLKAQVEGAGNDWGTIVTGLRRYDDSTKETRESLATSRLEAKRERRESGDWPKYQDKMSKLRVRETEAPFVSFAKLDDLAFHLLDISRKETTVGTADDLQRLLGRLTHERTARSWVESD